MDRFQLGSLVLHRIKLSKKKSPHSSHLEISIRFSHHPTLWDSFQTGICNSPTQFLSCSPHQSVTFVKNFIRMNVRIYSYQKDYTNEYPNVFILICLTQTNVRISIRIENCTNIRIYSNIRLGFTL